MAHEWLFVGLFLIIGIGFPVIPLVLSRIVAPRKPHALKHQTYECGMETVGDTWVQFKAQYYIFSLVFVIFDVEIVFLFPWAVAYRQLPFFAVLEGVLFILILAGGLVYAWRKGALDWV
ncbi:MAG: NADH-quinone oxidoreductase subunit A [Anaerolineales bacterium]|jgi:NADH:ubiquinone oxidoreductase subunit 3 (subunit A)|nr:NADH-quinone oxidoreductase subunit A [Anaerolineaceae bacterium]MDP7345735.1 NADH-quinone oxidoreductase subunit A [Anaerolineales bacterium]MDP7644130.1 NADH-quinone oxidoreductase subunit A [Anaerolineales bacterium]HJL69964.1 NADH-quinone oxidoreductase subunit A [Anaerolineales bacterium]HJN41842.1 NADH-quinone oxidoreductase subunit A [Anaerolineales bacterium]|tara:strand:+ start:168 stop:524 length:357 start_codon:yes stop_codon:yes gene_type:complete